MDEPANIDRDVVNEFGVVDKLYRLSLEWENRPVIIRRKVLPLLMRFLNNENEQICAAAAETLRLLAAHPDNTDLMCREPGLISAIVTHRKKAAADSRLRKALDGCILELRSSVPGATKQSSARYSEEPSRRAPSPSSESSRDTKVKGSDLDKDKDKHAGSTQRRSLLLQLDASDDALAAVNWEEVEQSLLHVPGIISYSIDADSCRITLFVATETRLIVTAVAASAGIAPSEVSVLRDIIAGGGAVAAPKTSAVPPPGGGFLDGDPGPATGEGDSSYMNSLAVQGGAGSLAERVETQKKLREQQRAEQRQARSGLSRFFSRVTAAFF